MTEKKRIEEEKAVKVVEKALADFEKGRDNVPYKKRIQNINRLTIIASILSIIAGALSLFSNFFERISLSPGLSSIKNSIWTGVILIVIGIFLGLFWLKNKRTNKLR